MLQISVGDFHLLSVSLVLGAARVAAPLDRVASVIGRCRSFRHRYPPDCRSAQMLMHSSGKTLAGRTA
jgi:hypothetical protein